MQNLIISLILFTPIFAFAQWEKGTPIREPRANIFNLNERELQSYVMAGRRHALFYPVTTTELLIPYGPMKDFFNSDEQDPVRKLLFKLAQVVTPFKSMDQVFNWLGLQDYPLKNQPENPNPFPPLTSAEKTLPMGATIIKNENGEGITFSCAACHSGNLFGVKIIGLTNRFPRSNEFFAHGKKVAPYVNSFVFRDMLKATEGERLMFLKSKDAVKYVGPKTPQVLGLDTSLPHTALSLALREADAYASKTKSYKRPRKSKLEKMVVDSKPAVWWNIKYKNRWLSDGSMISGNPIQMALVWNEVGRGADLRNLEDWFKQNDQKIRELTAAVFASQAPRYEKFFGINSINVEKARRGQVHFKNSCTKCHGSYQKGWELPEADRLTNTEKVQTIKVNYHEFTPVKDVGTDPNRYLGIYEFEKDLNRLHINKMIKMVAEAQRGYVPPPLVGIWARYPYLHNNSIPNLCSLLTPAAKRPRSYYSGEAIDRNRDFDQECVGYPLGIKTPASWKKKEYLYDTRREGLSNSGHERMFLDDYGREIYSDEEKRELIEFLKTL